MQYSQHPSRMHSWDSFTHPPSSLLSAAIKNTAISVLVSSIKSFSARIHCFFHPWAAAVVEGYNYMIAHARRDSYFEYSAETPPQDVGTLSVPCCKKWSRKVRDTPLGKNLRYMFSRVILVYKKKRPENVVLQKKIKNLTAGSAAKIQNDN